MNQNQRRLWDMLDTELRTREFAVSNIKETRSGLFVDLTSPGHPSKRSFFVFPDSLRETVDNGTLSERIRRDLTEPMRGIPAS
jgi:hypothetical protein